MTRASSEPFSNQAASQTNQQNSQHVNFRDGNHESHVQALYAWLHPALRDLPGIDWSKLSSRVIRTLVSIPGDSPHAPHIALAIGTAIGVIGASSLHYRVGELHALLSFVRTHCVTWDGTHLTKAVWEEYVSKTEATSRRRRYLLSYSAVTERHLADYVERLDPAVHARIAPYILPRLPARFLEQYGGAQEIIAEQRQRRKERSDVLAPLHSILVALIQFRKQAAQRLLSAFREACARAEAEEALPLQFNYEDVLPHINRDAKTVAEAQIEKRAVVLAFKLWNRQTWVKYHPDDVSRATRTNAKGRKKNYRSEREQYFVEFLGDSANLLWFGDLVANGIVMHLSALRRRSLSKNLPEEQLRRLAYAQALGATKGFYCERPGLFTPSGGFGQWLAYTFQRTGAAIFDPESLYRACLFGATLATVALTNGSRLTELLQISADRFKGHPYEEKINGQTTGKQRVIWLQYLLPKGKKTEAERQLFPLSPQSYELLREVGLLLKETHGCIPTVRPHPENSKAEDLKPERYLFQWQATADGQDGALSPSDVSVLLRFILHGLEFRTKQGEPFVVSTHLLRHVMATAARHEHEVPAEVLAFVLHHQQTGLAIPVATEYYSQMTEEQRLVALSEFMIDVEEQAASILLSMPDERTWEQMDEDLREVFERWHVLLETAFGFCGRVGLCPRSYQRNLCIGCPHLVPDPRKRESAVKWRETYAKQAEELETEGAEVDARQVRLQIQELDDLINSMDVMQQAIEDGTRQPAFLQLSSVRSDEVTINAEAYTFSSTS